MDRHTSQRAWRPKRYPSQTTVVNETSRRQSQVSLEPEKRSLPRTIRAVRDSHMPRPEGRTLIICLDGTGDKFDNDNSNVVEFVACLKKAHPSQVTYYQSGIGTYSGQGLKSGFAAGMDMAVGSSLGIHIKDAYRFLMQSYREGDRICLLGFSRGAYTVRCLAGMLHKVGLLPPRNVSQVNFAYEFYKDDSEEGWKMSGEFKKTFCEDVSVDFVGVWDCVASVGFFPRKLPFSKSPTNTIGYFRHAMALDEHRAKFKILQYVHDDPNASAQPKTIETKVKEKKNESVGRVRRAFKSCFGSKPKPTANGVSDKHSFSSSERSTSALDNFEKRMKEIEGNKDRRQELLEKQFDQNDPNAHKYRKTDVLEVWFSGCHADVGGGAVPNEQRHMLSRIPLRWMIRQCFECNTEILFDTAALAETGIDVDTVWPLYLAQKRPVVGPSPKMVDKYESGELPPLRHRSTVLDIEKAKRGHKDPEAKRNILAMEAQKQQLGAELALLPEHVEDHFDAMEPINDQLVQAKGWWILEVWPIKVRIQSKVSEEWKKVVRMNLGRFRAIRELEPKMHWSVQTRIDDNGYKIRNRLDKETVWQIYP